MVCKTYIYIVFKWSKLAIAYYRYFPRRVCKTCIAMFSSYFFVRLSVFVCRCSRPPCDFFFIEAEGIFRSHLYSTVFRFSAGFMGLMKCLLAKFQIKLQIDIILLNTTSHFLVSKSRKIICIIIYLQPKIVCREQCKHPVCSAAGVGRCRPVTRPPPAATVRVPLTV